MIRYFICFSFLFSQIVFAESLTDTQRKLMREMNEACRNKTSFARSICMSEQRVKKVVEKCGRSSDGVAQGSIVRGTVICGKPRDITQDSQGAPQNTQTRRHQKCQFESKSACKAFDFRMSRCMKSSSNKNMCKELANTFATKVEVHESLGDEGIKVYDRCVAKRDVTPKECARFAKFYIDEMKKKEEVASSNECPEFSTGDQNINCNGYEYKRVDSDLSDISRRVGKRSQRDTPTGAGTKTEASDSVDQ